MMIPSTVLNRIGRQAESGRTGPVIAYCDDDAGNEVEIFLKLSSGCDQGVINLAREAVAACLAADLGIPVPKPWLVRVPAEATSHDERVEKRLRGSNSVAFGSTSCLGHSAWPNGTCLERETFQTEASIFLFDAIIQNPDRRPSNPNCLVGDGELHVIDHELAFGHKLILGWKPPWEEGGMANLGEPDGHIFFQPLKEADIDYEPIRERWAGLSDERIAGYKAVIPAEWADAEAAVDEALKLIADARDNIAGCIREMERILS